MKIIAYIETDFHEKFGIPRQSGLVDDLKGVIVFEPEYRNPEALKGLDGFNYIWLLWQFEGTSRERWSATVKPPRLGGNTHMGVFATRSPFRPNSIGLSSVKLEGIDLETSRGPVIYVSGIDLRNHTPIYDIKPYLPYTDCHPDAIEGFAHAVKDYHLDVCFPQELLQILPESKRLAIIKVLEQDPRPSYHNDPNRRYGVAFAGYDVRFTVNGQLLTVVEVVPYTVNDEKS
jgi:tRNA-Thr(GGU) m(6)t(6)A37 methyltransferase TsaA